jgi:hypothetical protein
MRVRILLLTRTQSAVRNYLGCQPPGGAWHALASRLC